MPKQGEKDYLKNIGQAGIEHAINKPFSDEKCGYYLMELGAIMELLPKPPATLLDLGCGTGWTSCFFAKRGYEVTGQDIAEDMIVCANKNKDKEGLKNINFIECDYENMNLDNKFDCAVFYDSLHHSEDEKEAIKCVYKSLKDGGVLIVCEPGKGHGSNLESLDAANKYKVTEKDMPPDLIIKIGKEAGFREYKIYPRMIQLYKAIYLHPERSILKKMFKFNVVRIMVAIYLMVFYKNRMGIVVLKK
ncbi:MAG: hypothetical protein A2539_10420 [Elusimicrobia bacterium RIFOXYD2_FULL_34_15]|nr:MAG: hypothetical protein A2539_10420 [Elusimicrobia bacterium RIFOXYD2_FULL_34_15]